MANQSGCDTPTSDSKTIPERSERSCVFLCCHGCFRTIMIESTTKDARALFADGVGAYLAFSTCRVCLGPEGHGRSHGLKLAIKGHATAFEALNGSTESFISSEVYKAAPDIAGCEVTVIMNNRENSQGVKYVSILGVVAAMGMDHIMKDVDVKAWRRGESPVLTYLHGGIL